MHLNNLLRAYAEAGPDGDDPLCLQPTAPRFRAFTVRDPHRFSHPGKGRAALARDRAVEAGPCPRELRLSDHGQTPSCPARRSPVTGGERAGMVGATRTKGLDRIMSLPRDFAWSAMV